MQVYDYLFHSPAAPLYWEAIWAAIPIAVVCSLLSVLVVLKRLAFIGQGVSHAAFGGVGLATLLGLTGIAHFSVIAAFCVVAALGIAWTSDRKAVRTDTTIGIVLVASMAIGILLMQLWVSLRDQPWYVETFGRTTTSAGWESILFGSILGVGKDGAWLATIFGTFVLLILWWRRHNLLFYAFDETAAEAFGVRTTRCRYVLMLLLAITVVISIRLSGLILATALLILPGAVALRLSSRFVVVLVLSIISGLTGVLGGLLLSLQFNLPPGACMVMLLVILFVLTWPLGILNRKRVSLSSTTHTVRNHGVNNES